MNVPNWFWYLISSVIVLFVLANVVGGVFGYRRFRRMEQDFDEQRSRVRERLRRH